MTHCLVNFPRWLCPASGYYDHHCSGENATHPVPAASIVEVTLDEWLKHSAAVATMQQLTEWLERAVYMQARAADLSESYRRHSESPWDTTPHFEVLSALHILRWLTHRYRARSVRALRASSGHSAATLPPTFASTRRAPT